MSNRQRLLLLAAGVASLLTCIIYLDLVSIAPVYQVKQLMPPRMASYIPSNAKLSKLLMPIVLDSKWHGRSLIANTSPLTAFTEKIDVYHIAKEFGSGGLNISSLAEYNMRTLGDDALELRFIHDPPMTDSLDAANETTSIVTVLASSKQKYRVGDTVNLRLDVYNGRGQPLHRGGDQVRVWAVSKDKTYAIATEVTDLKNGSYLTTMPLLSTGQIKVKVSLTFNRETLRAISFVKLATVSTKYRVAGFLSSLAGEATLCSTVPFVPGGYAEYCNLTQYNGGLPWFCGKPRNKVLRCDHFNVLRNMDFIKPLPLTSAESLWLNWLDKKGNLRVVKRYSYINSHSIKSGLPTFDVKSQSKTRNIQIKLNCSDRSKVSTWTETAPRGYWHSKKWKPLACRMPKFDSSRTLACLNDVTVILLGDSNLRLAFYVLQDTTGCKLKITPKIGVRWHKPLHCVDKRKKIDVRWQPHGYPFHTRKAWDYRSDQKAANDYIDEIPNVGKFIVVVHIYLHLTTELAELYRVHIRAVRRSVERLLARNPNAKVIVRGPHTASKYSTECLRNDYYADTFTDIIQEEFQGLKDKVWFIQPWDMTVGIENTKAHPADFVNNAIMNLTLAHICKGV